MMSRRMVLIASGLLSATLTWLPMAAALRAENESDRIPFASRPTLGKQLLEKEGVYDSLLDAGNLETWMRQMTTRPHHAGSPKAKENAEFIARLFRSWGYQTEMETFHILFPTPRTRELTQLRPVAVTLDLDEKVIGSDSAAEALRAEALPPYNAYSGEGEAAGTLVYVNRGVPEDYEVLERFGIDVKGKIVMARYGGSWRGIKPKVAHEKGAIGCIIYNDPGDDGYTQGAAYPEGAFKHETAVQRGSVVDLPLRPGDPLTPFSGATEDANRLSREDSETIMKIPVLPISSSNAEKLLRTLDGPVAPDDWKGALPLTYRLGGGGQAVVSLKTEFNWNLVPARNVIARMPGREFPDEWVIRGNHHDAWVIGARDPMSGLVPLLEEARVLAVLRDQHGWRPRRSIVFGVWDAEEPGLLGSVEWCERHSAALREHAVAYINTDGNSRGFLSLAGSHSLEAAAAQVAHEVIDPQTGVSVSERLRASLLVNGSEEDKTRVKAREDLYLGALGSGSDYTAFLQHLGVPTLNVAFRGEGRGGEYHTSFDTFDHFTKFMDPGFEYGIALAKVCGRLTMRLAHAEVLPFDFRAPGDTYSRYADELVKLAETMREETRQFNEVVSSGRMRLAADPTLPFVAPKLKDAPPYLNFAPLLNAVQALNAAAQRYDRALKAYLASSNRTLAGERLRALNRALFQSEQALLREAGLPRRPWFRHQIYAPGYYTGYGVKTLPGAREGIEERRWEEAEAEITHIAEAVKRYVARIGKATGILNGE